MLTKSSMGNMFTWFQGVVQDRRDPLKIGRVRVRCLGIHAEDIKTLPVEHLPWATVMLPITSGVNDGNGNAPIGLMEGTWVIGFFRDGNLCQEPVIMGTLPAVPAEAYKGFSDPDGIYPSKVEVPTTNLLAYDATKSTISQIRNASLAKDIPTGKAHKADTVITNSKDASLYSEKTWSEPAPTFDKVKYPLNAVYQAEAGHVKEYDSTPGNERIHEYHTSGTFEEIRHDGSRVLKIVGDNYEIILGGSNVIVHGSVNLTINGDCRQLVTGNLIQEVVGDHFLTVHGNKVEKITGTHAVEVSTDRSVNITGKDIARIGASSERFVAMSSSETVGKNKINVCGGNNQFTQVSDLVFASSGKTIILGQEGMSIGTGGVMEIAAIETLDIKSKGALSIETEAEMNQSATGNITVQTDGSLESESSGDTTIRGANVKLNP